MDYILLANCFISVVGMISIVCCIYYIAYNLKKCRNLIDIFEVICVALFFISNSIFLLLSGFGIVSFTH